MKTPMQELIEYSDSLEHITHEEALHLICLKLTDLLEKEKQMIIDAYKEAQHEGHDYSEGTAEQYYNEKFKKLDNEK